MSAQNPKPTMTELVNRESGHIRDYMRGYGRSGAEPLRLLASVPDAEWRACAQRVLQARATRILESFDDDALMLIADGQICVQSLAAAAASEMEAACR